MSIERKDVLHVATLASLAVREDELDRLVQQLGDIVAYVDQLREVPMEEDAAVLRVGPGAVLLREDVVRPAPLAHPPAEFAPEMRDGLFLVPRHGAMEDA